MIVSKALKYSLRIFFFLIGSYVLCRAVMVDITNDEAYSFHNIKKIWPAEMLCTGNTHWINSIAIKCASLLGFESTLAVRWLSLVSFGGFLGLLFFFCRRCDNRFVNVSCVLFLLNPYMLDYFVLARGYASGMFFELAAIWFYYKGTVSENKRQLSLSLILSGLSAISNYSFIYFYAAFVSIFFFREHFANIKKSFKSGYFYLNLLSVILNMAFIMLAMDFIMDCTGDVTGAGTENISQFLNSFWETFLYGRKFSDQVVHVLTLISASLLAVSVFISIIRFKLHGDTLFYISGIIILLIFTIAILCWSLFSTVLPYERSALFLMPVLMIHLSLFFRYLPDPLFLKQGVLIAAACFVMFNFYLSFNFDHTRDYIEQSDNETILNELNRLNAVNVGLAGEVYGVYANYFLMKNKKEFSFNGFRIKKNTANYKIENKIIPDHLVLFPPYNLSAYKGKDINIQVLGLYQPSGAIILKLN